MILADTSVWVDFLRGAKRAARLATLLDENEVSIHPWVLGELALGNLGKRRNAILADLELLPQAPPIADGEILQLIDAHRLAGRGIGWVDVQLLGAALVASHRLWTFDRPLADTAKRLDIAA